MTGRRRLTKSMDSLDALKQNKVIETPGLLGCKFKGQTLVEVPNREGYVYVRLRSSPGEIIQAYNGMVSPVYDLPVIVIRTVGSTRYSIKGRDIGKYDKWGSSSYLPRHGAQHSFPEENWGGDIVWVYGRQFVPLAVCPSTGSMVGNVYVYPNVYYWNGNWIYAGNENSGDITDHNPTGSGARMLLIYLDISGSVHHYPSDTVFNEAYYLLHDIISYIPDLPADGVVPLGAVRLTSGTSTISWNRIYDLRPLVTGNDYPQPYFVQDEGSTLSRRTYMNFVGAGVIATDDPANNATLITIGGQTGSSGHIIQDNGSDQTARGKLNFVGSIFSVVDDPGHNATKITFGGGTGSYFGTPNKLTKFDSSGTWIVDAPIRDEDNLLYLDRSVIIEGTGDFLMVKGSITARDDLRATGTAKVGSLIVGNTTGTIGEDDAYIEGDLGIGGFLSVGSVTGSPSAGDAHVTGDIRAGGGLYLGSTIGNPDVGDAVYTGDLHPVRSGTSLLGSSYISLQSPIMHTTWNGTGTATAGQHTIDISSGFKTSTPRGGYIKAVIVFVECTWAAANNLSRIGFAYDSSAGADDEITAVRAQSTTYRQQAQVTIPCNSNGTFCMTCYNADALNVMLKLCGYYT